MTPQNIKEYIVVNEKIEYILEELGCHHIKSHDNGRYYTAGFPDGDNKKGFVLYYNDSLNVDSYTRNIKDKYGNSDIISLVCFIKGMYFSNALKWMCEIMGIDYYEDDVEEIPMSLQWTNLLFEMNTTISTEDNEKVKPINENILKTYYKCGNDLFLKDGISLKTQREFEIGLDLDSERITIPIRDELGTLVGVKGRLFNKSSCCNDDKYIYLEPCSKSKILYGLYKTMDYIKESGQCIVVESEKSVILLWEYGIKNAVSIGGHILSRTQVEKITRLGVNEVVLCYDEDVNRLDNSKVDRGEYIKEAQKFIEHIRVTAMVDVRGNILNKKESPVDNFEKYKLLYENRRVLQGEKNKTN